MEWISVKNKLPEPRILVIVACEMTKGCTPMHFETAFLEDFWGKEEWRGAGVWRGKIKGVTHWMPLPEPPKEE